ncbi:MAG: endonuclease/exonuclease/phosphatase family protein [Candidatus Krumholzibacteriota bacterium]
MSISSRIIACALFCLLVPGFALANLEPIHLDGNFDDWAGLTAVHDDSNDDSGTVDFGRIWVANDQDYLYIRFETEGNVQPDEQQNMRLYIDTDMNAGTGTSFNGIGAELMWEFGWREGTFKPGSTYTVEHADVGLMIGPTVSNTEFEVAFRRDAIPAGGQALFNGGDIRFIFYDTDSGDVAPNSGSIAYTFTAGSIATPGLALTRDDPAHIRIATWNVQSDGLFDGGSAESAQNRMLDAMDPDVVVVNEVWYHNATEVRDMIEQHLPSGAGEDWYAVMRDAGNVIVSRYPILQSWEVNPGYRVTAALLDLGAVSDKDLLLIANHWRCCTADQDRQNEADSVIGFLRDAKTAGGVVTVPEGTPFVLCGDLNLVGWRQQLDTIITGDIQDEGTYGADAAPDWDGSNFINPLSRQPDFRAGYTWRNDFSTYYPGVLDYVMYTDSVLDLHNHYVLETRTMTPANLAAHGLQQYDTTDASDHAPRVADFTVFNPLSPVPQTPTAGDARLMPNIPNPFNPSTEIRFELDRPGAVELNIYDARGHLVRGLVSGHFETGPFNAMWDGTDRAGRQVASGVYQVRMMVRMGGETVVRTRSITLVE